MDESVPYYYGILHFQPTQVTFPNHLNLVSFPVRGCNVQLVNNTQVVYILHNRYKSAKTIHKSVNQQHQQQHKLISPKGEFKG
mgnify:CR=1 FL=1